MEELLKLVRAEGRKNNYLRRAFNDGEFPSDEVAREIGCEQLFRLASDNVEFRTKLHLDMLASDERLIAFMESYVSVAQEQGIKHPNVAHFTEIIRDYRNDSQRIREHLVNIVMRGYDSGW